MHSRFRFKLFILLGSALLGGLLAGCDLLRPAEPTPTLAPTAVSNVTPTPIPTQMATLPPTQTPTAVPPSPTQPACTHALAFVADVTIPDNSVLPPGQTFVKTWRVRNSGDCAWPAGSAWVFAAGDQMNGPDTVAVPQTQPGETADISVTLTAPATPGVYTGYWQLRLPNGERLPTRPFVRIAVAAPLPTSTPTPPPTLAPTAVVTVPPPPTTTPAPLAPRIDFFRANVEIADPGDTIELSWATTNAGQVTLYKLLPSGQLGSFWDVPLSGSFSYDIAPNERNATAFALFATGAGDQRAQATLSVTLRCLDNWFFRPAPDECPQTAPLYSAGAEQPFERGRMLWVGDQGLIYVLFADGNYPRYAIFSDRWEEGDPVDDSGIEPPPGLQQPVRGFGLIWREESSVRARLGWATDRERAYGSAYQSTARFKYNEFYIRALDGNVWRFLPEGSGWEKMQVSSGG